MTGTTRVFISYSHESEAHSSAVLELAQRLRQQGVDAWIDRFTESPPEGWPRWVTHQIETAEFVVCICSPTYRRAFDGHNDPQRGLGVNEEGFIIAQDLYDCGNNTERYVPVLFDGAYPDNIPIMLRPFTHYALPGEFDAFYARLTRQQLAAPSPIGTVRMISPSLPHLDPSSPGFVQQSDVVEFLRPELHSLERLAPGDGLFLSRLINPLNRFDSSVVMTCWVAARGPVQYLLDGARIEDHAIAGLGPTGEVALPPDAEYRFRFHDGAKYETALSPALSIGPETRRFASFTVSMSPDEPLYFYGVLCVTISYQGSDGSRGSLFLRPPPSVAALARLLGDDVLVAEYIDGERGAVLMEQVVTPNGVQRAREEGRDYPLEYIPIHFGDLPRSRAQCLSEREQSYAQLRRRTRLHERARGLVEPLVALLGKGESWAGDMLGAMGDDASMAAIRSTLEQSPADPVALQGLMTRHLIRRDDELPRHILTNRAAFFVDYASRSLLTDAAGSILRAAGQNGWEVLDLLVQSGICSPREILVLAGADMPPMERNRLVEMWGGPIGGELHVRGSMHDWVSPPPVETRLHYRGEDRYEGVLQLPSGPIQLKLADSEWTRGCNFGAPEGTGSLRIGEPYSLVESELSKNIEFVVPNNGSFRFQVDAGDPEYPQLLVTPL